MTYCHSSLDTWQYIRHQLGFVSLPLTLFLTISLISFNSRGQARNFYFNGNRLHRTLFSFFKLNCLALACEKLRNKRLAHI
ncbi:hypothetical protein K2173_023075 [Erythroxylum novogranatense]|uniref:Uncharacterized protein n=1 Tax=Erythroxylum novogranatense TaxID=1862640 RepID=A0AAV8T9F8_9ROSI|nr:hypothetical protein K2173_023075 [Erythroxylum novogranatense]